jgi:general stress protein 26
VSILSDRTSGRGRAEFFIDKSTQKSDADNGMHFAPVRLRMRLQPCFGNRIVIREEAAMNNAKTHTVSTPSADEREEIWKRVDDIRFGILSTVDADGSINARPLTTQQVEHESRLLYFIAADGALAHLAERTAQVNVTYSDSRDNFFVSLGGTASIYRDVAKAKQLWGKMNEAWFPGGPTDPNLALLRVDVARVEYWDSGSSRIVQFLTMANAAITKSPPDAGEHGKFHP